MQYRDLIHACEDKFFAKVLEAKATKGDTGIVLLADLMITFSVPLQPQGQPPVNFTHLITSDHYPMYTLEIFFGFLLKKMKVFNRALNEGEKILSQDKIDVALSKIPTPDLQDAI